MSAPLPLTPSRVSSALCGVNDPVLRLQSLPNPPDDDQLGYIETPLQNISVMALPGSGKTTATTLKIVYHHLTREFASPDSFLLVTYTRNAAKEMRDIGKQHLAALGESAELFTIRNTRTIDSFAYGLMKAIQGEVKNHRKVIEEAWAWLDNTPDAVVQSLRTLEKYKSLRCIFVDEAQDTKEQHYLFLRKFVAKFNNIPIILIGDPNQKLYNNCSSDIFHQHNPEVSPLILPNNYRSVKTIVKMSNLMMPRDASDQMKMKATRAVVGERSKLFACSTLTASLQKLFVLLTEDQGLRMRGKVAFVCPTRKAGDGLADKLRLLDVSFVKHYSNRADDEEDPTVSIDEASDDHDDAGGVGGDTALKKRKHKPKTLPAELAHQGTFPLFTEDQKIHIYTIHGSKGLGFHTVVLLDFHKYMWNTPNKYYTKEKQAEFERFWFTAATRAKDYLYFIATPEQQLWQAWMHISPYVDVVGISPYLLTTGSYVR